MLRQGLQRIARNLKVRGTDLEKIVFDQPTHNIRYGQETYNRHRTVTPFEHRKPNISRDSFVAPSAAVSGAVVLNDKSSVWYDTVLRGDHNVISVGAYTNVQDGTVISTSGDNTSPKMCEIGDYVTIGHKCVIQAATIEQMTLIGMNSFIGDDVVIEKNAVIAAGTILPKGTIVRGNELWAGKPGRKIRDITLEEREFILESAEEYYNLSLQHRDEFYLPFTTAYQELEQGNER